MEIQARSKKRRLKKWVRMVIGGAIVVGLFLGVTILTNLFFNDPMSAENTEASKALDDIGKLKKNGDESPKVSVTWTEDEVIEMMHQMTHQKVVADTKWGSIEMTPERVKTLIDVVETEEYPHSDELLEILKRWDKGDFSQVDDDHNTLWTIQGGTIGYATGILSEEEEAEFIKHNFR